MNQQTVQVGIADAACFTGRKKMRKSSGGRVPFIKTRVLGTDPQVGVSILVYLADDISAEGVLSALRKEFLEQVILFGIIIDAAEIGSCPDASLAVLAKGIDGVIGDRVRV